MVTRRGVATSKAIFRYVSVSVPNFARAEVYCLLRLRSRAGFSKEAVYKGTEAVQPDMRELVIVQLLRFATAVQTRCVDPDGRQPIWLSGIWGFRNQTAAASDSPTMPVRRCGDRAITRIAPAKA